jgi:hypothetical protein
MTSCDFRRGAPQRGQQRAKAIFVGQSRATGDLLAALENHDGRQSPNAVPAGEVRPCVRVDGPDENAPQCLFGDSGDDGV